MEHHGTEAYKALAIATGTLFDCYIKGVNASRGVVTSNHPIASATGMQMPGHRWQRSGVDPHLNTYLAV